jgi:hypothetical protein
MLFANVLAMLEIHGEISSLSYTRQSDNVRRTMDASLTRNRIVRPLSVRGTRS